MVLFAIVNAYYEFLIVEFGINGRVSDGGVIEYTEFFKRLVNKELNIPTLVSTDGLPHVFIGDEAFALRTDFMIPFSQKVLTKERRVYNYRFCRTRRVVENAFGILAARFRIFHTAINLKPENIDNVVLCCCVLHNFLRRNCSSTYIKESDLSDEDQSDENSSYLDLQVGRARNAKEQAKIVRNMFVDYFNKK